MDDTHIYVGDYTMIGPNVTIATAGHPICPELRQKNYQYNAPVTIGRNCWIGAGSVVTKDLPSDCVCVGNPCKVLRKVDQRDREYYWGNRPIDWNEI